MTRDLSGVGNVRPLYVPKGRYHLRCVEAKLAWSRENDRQWNVRFAVVNGEFAGALIYDNLIFTKDADSFLLRKATTFLRAMRVPLENFDDEYPEILLGREFSAETEIEERPQPTGGVKHYSRIIAHTLQHLDKWSHEYKAVPKPKRSEAPTHPVGDPFNQSSTPF